MRGNAACVACMRCHIGGGSQGSCLLLFFSLCPEGFGVFCSRGDRRQVLVRFVGFFTSTADVHASVRRASGKISAAYVSTQERGGGVLAIMQAVVV